MAKKKQKRRRPSGTATTAAVSKRQEQKEAARIRREEARKAELRKGVWRRALIGGLVGLLVFVGITWFTNRTPAAKPFPDVSAQTAAAAGCAPLTQPEASPTRNHLPADQITYANHPATAGDHVDTPLEPITQRTYTTPVLEAAAVHTLEHGSVILYYRPTADPDGLPQRVIDQLATVATNNRATYLIPYPDLPEGTALAYTAWNQLLTCPAGITPDQAVTVGNGFIDAFACTKNAPEGSLGDGC